MDVINFLKDISDNAKTHFKEDNIIEEIYHNSRQDKYGDISPWFKENLKSVKCNMLRTYRGVEDVYVDSIITGIESFGEDYNTKDFIFSVSNDAESAVLVALMDTMNKSKNNYNIRPYIFQVDGNNNEDVNEAIDLCNHYNMNYKVVDITETYKNITAQLGANSFDKIRTHKLFSRIASTYLYDQATLHKGIVLSSLNFSRKCGGRLVENGDVGHFYPLMGLFKSTEIPAIAKELDVPSKFWREENLEGNFKPNDFDMSVLEFDILSCLFLIATSIHYRYMLSLGKYDEYSAIAYDREEIENTMTDTTNGVNLNEEDYNKVSIFLDSIYINYFNKSSFGFCIDTPITNKLDLLEIANSLL